MIQVRRLTRTETTSSIVIYFSLFIALGGLLTLPFGWVDFPPSANRLIGLWWLAKILYPELFSENIREIARDFYARFYHVRPTEAQIDAVLEGRG